MSDTANIAPAATRYRLAEKVYDPETGHGELECYKRPDGKFDLTIYCGKDDLSMYGLTPRELVEAARIMEVLAASVDPMAVLKR